MKRKRMKSRNHKITPETVRELEAAVQQMAQAEQKALPQVPEEDRRPWSNSPGAPPPDWFDRVQDAAAGRGGAFGGVVRRTRPDW